MDLNLFNIKNSNDFVALIVGKRNKGKSYLLIQLLITKINGLKGKFNEFVVVNPTFKYDKKYQLIEIKEENKYYEFNENLVNDLDNYFMMKKEEDKNYHGLVIFDDCISSKKFSNKQNDSPLANMASLSRNKGYSIIILSQRYKGVPFSVRTQADYIFLFDTKNKTEYETIYDEVGIGDKDEWKSIWEWNLRNKNDFHSWFMLSTLDDKIYEKNELNLKKLP